MFSVWGLFITKCFVNVNSICTILCTPLSLSLSVFKPSFLSFLRSPKPSKEILLYCTVCLYCFLSVCYIDLFPSSVSLTDTRVHAPHPDMHALCFDLIHFHLRNKIQQNKTKKTRFISSRSLPWQSCDGINVSQHALPHLVTLSEKSYIPLHKLFTRRVV